jgi:hypothetical protein
MNKDNSWIDTVDDRTIYTTAFICSLLTSLFAILNNSLLNSDAAVYIASAEMFSAKGLSAATAIYSNPFFPILAGSLSKLTGLNVTTCAQILTAILYGLITVSFIRVIKALDGSQLAKIIAAGVILLHPSVNGYKDYIIRDIGYWAFSLLALSFLINYCKTLTLKNATAWICAQVIATLFRPEGILFILIAPLVVTVISRNHENRKKLIFHGIIGVFTLILVIILSLLNNDTDLAESVLTTIQGRLDQLLQIYETYEKLKHQMTVHVLNYHSSDSAGIALFFALIPIFFKAVLNAIGWQAILFLSYATYKKEVVIPNNRLLFSYIGIASAIILGFLLTERFLQARYAMLISILLLPILVFTLEKTVISLTSAPKGKYIFTAVVIVCFIDSFISFGHSKHYIVETKDWIYQNTGENQCILSNKRAMTFSINRPREAKFALAMNNNLQQQALVMAEERCPYYILLEDNDGFSGETSINKFTNSYTEVQRYTNSRGDKAIIYSR